MGTATILVPTSSCCGSSRGTSASSTGLLQKTGLYSLQLPRHRCAGYRQFLIRMVPRRHGRAAVVSNCLLPTTCDIEIDKLSAETPALLAVCSDLDWQKCSRQLREEAFRSLQSGGERYMRLKRLESLMRGWLHDSMLETVLQPSRSGAPGTVLDERCLLHSVEYLRLHARLQAAEELTESVDHTFDWEAAAAQLHHSVDHPQSQQGLWQSWVAREDMAQAADRLNKEAFDTQNPGSSSNIKENVSQKHEEEAEGSLQSRAVLKKGEMQSMLQTTGAAVAGLLGGRVMDAVAADGPISLKLMPESIEAATRVPGWLGPSVLAFPVVSYFLFNIYREKVNPYAKVTDWMFGVVAVVIIANILMIATLGVRLY
ncbi:hypothetical protein CY35_05G131100 [Sphagnum magellanicum]|nr:hypothetical protein CY35_05G131100 [Sphagnum magellanicum]KAH9563549.1 hypothetical protein CY35_05G131100 [Sphagnum magellanicum]